MTPKSLRRRSLFCLTLLSVECTHTNLVPDTASRSNDWTAIIDDLLAFHAAVLHDSTRIDACSIAQATGDSAILRRLSPRARNVLTSECAPFGTPIAGSRRGLLSIKKFPDSIVADIEAVDGHYFHVASYKAVVISKPPGFSFAAVTFHDFGSVAGPPPPPPPPKKDLR